MAVVAPSPIDTLPTPPSTTDPGNFDNRADAFLSGLPNFGAQANALGANVYANAVIAAEGGALAASAINSPGTSATSTTSLLIGAGSKSLTLTQTGKAFAIGQEVRIADTANAAVNWMQGIITAFNSSTGAMTVSVSTAQGAGTVSAWTISIAGFRSTDPGRLDFLFCLAS